VTHFSYGKMRSSFSPASVGVQAKTADRVAKQGPRLSKVKVHHGDYEKVIRQYDSPDTVFFLDPPYAGYDADVGERKFDEQRFFEVLKSIKGKWLLTYGIRGELPKLLKGSRFHVRRIRTPRTIRAMRGVGGSSVLTQLLVSNYVLPKKSLFACADDAFEVDLASDDAFEQEVELIKGADPDDERYVLGVVLEPETVDAQGDIYSAAEIRQAAHRFMEEFRGLGVQHKMRVNDQVRILESYLAPQAFELAGRTIHKGTWLLAVRVLADALWQQVKEGMFTGFSIGGSARRTEETTPPPTYEHDEDGEHTALGKADTSDVDEKKIHRLLDMIVEEVSLVDRAANRQRFLIVKRDSTMATQAPASGSKSPDKAPQAQDLDATADALEELTNLVEAALAAGDGEAQRAALSRLGALTKALELDSETAPAPDDGADDPENETTETHSSDDAATPSPPGAPTDASPPTPSNLLQGLATLAHQVLTQLHVSTPTSAPAPPTKASATPESGTPGEQITAALRAITHTVRTQQQRIARLEKNTTLPASQPVGERTLTQSGDDKWPLDLNTPFDRKSIDDDLSFFDA